MTLTELFGPLAPVALLGVLAGLAIVVALLATESWMTARRRAVTRREEQASHSPSASCLRPAA